MVNRQNEITERVTKINDNCEDLKNGIVDLEGNFVEEVKKAFLEEVGVLVDENFKGLREIVKGVSSSKKIKKKKESVKKGKGKKRGRPKKVDLVKVESVKEEEAGLDISPLE